jgi:hypothetical protein
MNYPIPVNHQEIVALRNKPVDEDLIAAAIAGVITIARSEGQTLDDITAQVLADDHLLDQSQRRWLSDIVAEAWATL